MTKEYIDRRAVEAKAVYMHGFGRNKYVPLKAIQQAPAADVVKVKYGQPLTLEELRQMDGSPVWVEVIDHSVFADEADDFDGWGMVRKSWVRVWDEERADLVKVDYHFEDYGKEWQAYSLPVKHGRWLSAYEYALKLGITDKEKLEEVKKDIWWKFCNDCEEGVKGFHNYCPNCGADMRGGNSG